MGILSVSIVLSKHVCKHDSLKFKMKPPSNPPLGVDLSGE